MTTLGKLLEELNIDTSDIDDDGSDNNNNDEVNIDDVNLDDVPENLQPVFKKMKETLDTSQNEIAKRDLVINTLKDQFNAGNKGNDNNNNNNNNNDDEKVLGVLDKDDPYAPVFQKLAEAVDGIKQKTTVDKEQEFIGNLKSFAQENPDIVRYAETMDKIVEKHPTMKEDIPTLYNMAKSMQERRDTKANDKENEVNRHRNARSFSNESPGASSRNSVDVVESKSISEAMENTLKQANTR
jgi:hypothetical protein